MQASAPIEQVAKGSMAYPERGSINRLFFKTPLIWWRMGMGSILGSSMVVLTTWGRRSHLPRHTMLSYTPMKSCIYVGAGWGERCDWYKNLLADSHVTLQVWSEDVTGVRGEAILPALARLVTDEDEFRAVSRRLFETGGDSHFKPWLSSLGIAYDHEDLVAKRDRVRQVALDLQSIEAGGSVVRSAYPPAMETDLKWMWAVIAGSFGLGWIMGRRSK